MVAYVENAVSFLASNGRLIDRRRLQFILGEGTSEDVWAVLRAYRNVDGGYGWGLEPDLRAPESQPVGAMHALEVMADPGVTSATEVNHVLELCAWLESRSLPDGGLPFALPMRDPSGTAPLWASAKPDISSLQMTAQVVAQLHLIGRSHPAVASHPWLVRASNYCFEVLSADAFVPNAHELLFALRMLDAVATIDPRTDELIHRLAGHLPRDGIVPVEGGAPGEALHLLDLSPRPDNPSRRLFNEDAVAADLARLRSEQQPDGGWSVNFDAYSPAAALEWRSYATVQALVTLRLHGA